MYHQLTLSSLLHFALNDFLHIVGGSLCKGKQTYLVQMYTCTMHIQQVLVVFSFKATQKIISCVTAACALFSKNSIELKSLHVIYVQYLQILTILGRLKSVILSCHEYVVHATSPNTSTHIVT